MVELKQCLCLLFDEKLSPIFLVIDIRDNFFDLLENVILLFKSEITYEKNRF